MTLSASSNKDDYVADGTLGTYSYTFPIKAQTDLVVTVADDDGVEFDVLTLTTDYTVTGVGVKTGGTIVFVESGQSWLDGGGLLNTGYLLNIRRIRPLTQLTDIRNQGDFFSEAHEDQFDDMIMICQQLQEQIDRAVIAGATGSGSTVEELSAAIAAALAAQAAAEAAQAAAEAAQAAAEASAVDSASSASDAQTAQTAAELAETGAQAAQAAAESVYDVDTIIKAWINFNGTGSIAIRNSFNVSSIVDNSAGNYTVNWDTDFADVNYAATVTSRNNQTLFGATTFTAASLQVETQNSSGAPQDDQIICVIAIGDQ